MSEVEGSGASGGGGEPALDARGWSAVGRTRSHNEDSWGIDPETGLFLVADGMGGHSHGEVASRVAVEEIRRVVAEGELADGGDCAEAGGPCRTDLLEHAFRLAHRRVLAEIQADRVLGGMGTTLVAFLVGGATGTIAHVGDSRAYRLRDGELELLTQDHTWVHEQVRAGLLSEEQARVHPLKNVVTRALGGDGYLTVDVGEVELEPGDRYLLCSDGLTTVVEDAEIAERLASDEPLEAVCRGLVEAAQEQGSYDDVTVVAIRVE